jgi:hypothetical protein
MSLPPLKSATDLSLDVDDDVNVNKKLTILKHIKKKAANDAQLLM